MRCRPAEGVLCAVLIMWAVQSAINHSAFACCCVLSNYRREMGREPPVLLPSEKLQTLAKHGTTVASVLFTESLHDSIYSRLHVSNTVAACRFRPLESCGRVVRSSPRCLVALVSASGGPAPCPPSTLCPPSLCGLAPPPQHRAIIQTCTLTSPSPRDCSEPSQTETIPCAAILTYTLTRAARTGDATQTRLRRRIPSPGLQSSDPPSTYTP